VSFEVPKVDEKLPFPLKKDLTIFTADSTTWRAHTSSDLPET